MEISIGGAGNIFKRLKCPISLIALITIVILIFSFALIFQIIPTEIKTKPIPTPPQSPTPTPAQTPIPTSTQAPHLTPTQITTPTPVQSSSSPIYVSGGRIFGGDLQDNTIQWGKLYLGFSANASFYLQSTGNLPVVLSFEASEWSPSGIGSYLSVSWDYNGSQLEPNQTILLTITLTSPLSEDFANYLISNNVTTFSFSLYIIATAS